MAKLHEVETEITFRPRIAIEDGAFEINICPVCGAEIRDVEVHNVTKEGFFKDLCYRYAEIECPECNAIFEKTVYDNYERKAFSEIALNITTVTFILALIGIIVFAILINIIPNIALTVVIACFIVLVIDSVILLILQ